MSTCAVPDPPRHALGTVQQLAAESAGHAKALRTLRAYARDRKDFVAWTAAHDRQALPGEGDILAMYLADLGWAPAAPVHPRLRCAWRTSRRRTRSSTCPALPARAPYGAGSPASAAASARPRPPKHRSRSTTWWPGWGKMSTSSLHELRDNAVLPLGFARAFRRSKLVSLDGADLAYTRAGLIVTLRPSKTDEKAAGRRVGVPFGHRSPLKVRRHIRDGELVRDNAAAKVL